MLKQPKTLRSIQNGQLAGQNGMLIRVITATACTLLAFLSCSVFAAKNPNERWYQVDLILFEHTDPNHLSNELWDTIATKPLPNEYHVVDRLDAQLNINETNGPSGLYTAYQHFSPELPDLSELRAFAQLPADQSANSDWLARLQNNDGYRILFDGSWRQPITNKQDAIPLRIFGGDQFGDQFELDGTVLIHVARYLHIETDLIFSRYQPINTDSISVDDIFNASNPNLDSAQYFNSPVEAGAKLDNSKLNSDSPFSEQDNQKYIPVEAIPFQQKRRMRSREVHYIDHPKLGLIIRFEPYELPEFE